MRSEKEIRERLREWEEVRKKAEENSDISETLKEFVGASNHIYELKWILGEH